MAHNYNFIYIFALKQINKKSYFLSKILLWVCYFIFPKLKQNSLFLIVEILKRKKKYNRALLLLNRCKNKEDIDFLYHLGNIYFKLGKYNEANDIIKKIIKKFILLNNFDYGIISDIIIIYNEIGNYQQAIELIHLIEKRNEFKKIEKNILELLYCNIGDTYIKINNFDTAISYYNKSLECNSVQAKVLMNLGICYYQMNKHSIALEYYNKALLQTKEQKIIGSILYNIGCVYTEMNEMQKAQDYFNDAALKGNKLAEKEIGK